MSHYTSYLEKTSKKCNNFSPFLHFVLNKIISLQVINKSSAFCYILVFRNLRNFKKVQEKTANVRVMRTCLFVPQVISQDL